MLEHIRDKVLGLKEEERRKFYSACFSFPSSQALGFSELMEVIQKIPSRDEVRIFLSLENEDPFIIVKNSTEAEYRAFIEETLEDEMIFTKIEINKTLADGHFSIYRYQKFVEDIVGLSMEDVLKTFSMFLDGAGKVVSYLGYLGVTLDKEANGVRGEEIVISTPDSKVKVAVIPTNEELAICRETVALV